MNSKTPAQFVTLPARSLISVAGPDAIKFLQGLITNDIHKLDTQPALHACLLTAQGKFLHDFFITRSGDIYHIECEGGDRAQDLFRRLTMYKLRAQVTLTLEESLHVYAVFGSYSQGYADPRHSSLGFRTTQKPDLPESPFSFWDTTRIRLNIADGSRDAELEKSTLEELNMADTAVSFNKGCYVGQELTTRMEMRGLGKKHLMPLAFNMPVPAPGDDIILEDRTIGSMRSSCQSIGLALIRDDALEILKDTYDQSPLYLLGQ